MHRLGVTVITHSELHPARVRGHLHPMPGARVAHESTASPAMMSPNDHGKHRGPAEHASVRRIVLGPLLLAGHLLRHRKRHIRSLNVNRIYRLQQGVV